jgi:lipopolysaccharide export system permease protein
MDIAAPAQADFIASGQSMTLFRYVLYRFFAAFARVGLIIAAVLFLVGLIDQLPSLREGDTILRAAYLAILSQMNTLYTSLPLVVIIAAIVQFLAMSKSSEIVVVRASGQSGLKFLFAPCLGAFLVGLIGVAVLNPMASSMTAQFDREKGRSAQSTVVNISASGLWLRQGTAQAQTMIFAKSFENAGLNLREASFLSFDSAGAPHLRTEAATATLTPQGWVLTGALQWDLTAINPQEMRISLPDGAAIPSDLQPEDLLSGVGNPSLVPFWQLPAQIATLEAAGFSATPFRVWWQSELAKPLFLVVMVLIAAGFTMRHIRAGNRAQMVVVAVLAGFGIFFLRNVAQVFGQNGQIPILLAAWGPTLAASLLAVSLLLHLEDG